MRIELGNTNYEFRPWKPALGRVFAGAFAFDCETARISDEMPWLTPPIPLHAQALSPIAYGDSCVMFWG